MSENFTNSSSAKTNSFSKGMVKDYTDIYMSEGLWTNAINAINNSHYGETGSIGNEPSNKLCVTAPYTIIGFAHITQTRWVLFSTNDTDSEIGIFDESDCSYTKTVKDPCLGFKRTHLITAVVKKNYDCSYSAYFADNLNPDRTLNLDKVPYKIIGDANPDADCYEPLYSTELDCDALRLHPLLDQPCVSVKKALGAGQLNNGSYMACVAYSENGVRLTDYCIPSVPQPLWDHTGIGGAIEINIENLDQNFEEYELVVISIINQQTIAKKIGNYSIRQKTVALDLFLQSLVTVELAQIPLRSIVYEKSEKLFNVNGYLIRTGVTTQPYFNYQDQANRIQASWVAAEYPKDYYWNGGNKLSYMRDEIYAFFIRWVYKTGARSASFHIPGRIANPLDRQAVSTSDVVYPTETQNWQVYDTATKNVASGSLIDGGEIIAKGSMAYWESTERYPDDKEEVWGELCGKPIRHHKMPSNETIHIHNQGGDKIVLLGVEFSNITPPLDEKGLPIQDIVGYEILRGSREGNRSVIAKGMFNNMLEYNIAGTTSTKGLFQNYPYNDLRPDNFLTDDYTVLDQGYGNPSKIEEASKLSNYKRDIFSFHSVETSFVKPYLGSGSHVKIYTEERGSVVGKFEYPFKHPKHIILTDTTFLIAAAVGVGIAALASLGKTTTTGGQFPLVAASGSPFGYASRESGSGTISTDLVNANLLQASSGFAAGSVASTIAGVASLVAASAYYFGQGVDQVLDVIRNFSKKRQYALQYNSHGFYSNFSPVSNAAVPVGLSPSLRRPVTTSGTKYIGAGMYELDANHRINNINRNKYVAVKLTSTIPDPVSSVDKTKHRVRDGGVSHADPMKNEVRTDTVAYYGALKVDYQNQYGQLQSIVQLPTDSCVYSTSPNAVVPYTSNLIFGGDVYINRYTEKNPYMFFNTWMFDMPDKTEYDYRNYINGPAPRYWSNFEKFDGQDFDVQLFPNGLSAPFFNAVTPSDFHRLDRPSAVSGALVVKNAYMYLFHNGVRDFFTESELNMSFRDYGENDYEKFYDIYGNSFNDLSTMFRSDLITKPIYHKYDLSLSSSKLFNNFASWGSILPRDFDPRIYSTCFEYYAKRAIYSLQQQDGLRRDNWRNYLPLNYKDFAGRINTIKNLNATGAMILFEDAEPVMFAGVDQLQTQNGVKVSIGDGGLFQGNQQGIVNADDTLGYASSISSRAAVNTPFGLFFVSQKSGKIMQYQGGIQEISRNGMKFWFNENLPSKMLQQYPNYPLYDNPVVGIGVQAIYDPQYELLYFTKRDYTPLRDDLLFDAPNGVPYYICGTTDIELPPPCVKRATGRISSTAYNESGITLSWIAPPLLETEEQPLSYKVVFAFEQTGVYTPLGTPSPSIVSGNVLSKSYPMLLDYAGGTHSLNTTNIYRITVTTVYNCGEIVSYVTGTLAQITAGTAVMTYPAGQGGPSTNPILDIIPGTPSTSSELCTAPIDIAFVLDITGSMGDTLDNLKTSIASIAADAALKSDNDYRLGLITVNESSGGPAINIVREMFSLNNIDTFQDAIDPLFVSGGGSYPEPTDTAIQSVLDGALGAFRSNAIKMIIMITDALPSGGDDVYSSGVEPFVVQTLANDAAYVGVKIYPIATGSGATDASVLAIHNYYSSITGGVSNVSESGIIDAIVSDEILNVPCPEQLNCLISATETVINKGHSTKLTWDGGDAVSATLSGIGNVPIAGSLTLTLTETTTFTFIATAANDTALSCSVTIVVIPVTVTKCPCEFDNPECFTKCDWTISYDPKNKQWISFHDWKPTLVMPSYKHFFTIRDNSIWRHNDRWDSFCNYYGTDYPWEVEYPVVTPNSITTMRNIEYTLDVYKFYNDGKDFHHVLDENFDRAVIYNSEQISGLLRLRLKGKNAPLDMISYPQITPNGIDILYSKEENKFRFNQFWDITKDRGEFTVNKDPMFNTRCSGYIKDINPNYIDYFKSTLERKKFRHYGNSIILRKNLSLDNKFILKLTNSKHLNSSR